MQSPDSSKQLPSPRGCCGFGCLSVFVLVLALRLWDMQPYILSADSPKGRFTAEARVTYGLFEILGGTAYLTLHDKQSKQTRTVRKWVGAGWFDSDWPTGIEWQDDSRRVAFLQRDDLFHRSSSNYEIKWSENGFAHYEDNSTHNWLKIQMKRKAHVGSPQQKAKYRELVRQFYGE